MQKWEYCLVLQHTSAELWIWGPDGQTDKLKGAEWNFVRAISELGSRGWEAVNYNVEGVETGSFKLWPLRGNRELLFKRPIEN